MLRLCIVLVFVAFANSQVHQKNKKVQMETVEEVADKVAKIRHPLLNLAPKEFKKEVKEGKIKFDHIQDIENKTVAAVCKCDNGKVPAEAGDQIVLSGFKGDETPEELCSLMCDELEKDSTQQKPRNKRQIGFGFGHFGFGGLFNGLPVGYGSLGFDLAGAGGLMGLGGCGYTCSANLCGGGAPLGLGLGSLAAPLPAYGAGLGLGVAPLPLAGFDSFGAALGGFGDASLIGSGFYGGLGLGLGNGMCWGCQRSWLPPPIAPLPIAPLSLAPFAFPPPAFPAPLPVTIPRYVDVPIRRPVDVPIIRRVDVPVPRPFNVPVVRPIDVPVVRQISVPQPIPVPMPIIRPVQVQAQQAVPVRRVIQVRRVLRMRPAVRRVQGVVAIPVSGVALRAGQSGSASWSSSGGDVSGAGLSLGDLSQFSSGFDGASLSSAPTDAGAYAQGASAQYYQNYPTGSYQASSGATDAASYYGASGASAGNAANYYPQSYGQGASAGVYPSSASGQSQQYYYPSADASGAATMSGSQQYVYPGTDSSSFQSSAFQSGTYPMPPKTN